MSSSYVGLNTYANSIVIPSDGDPAVAESVDIALRTLANNTVYLNTQLAHQAFDDRGKTSTVTGNIVLNDGGGSVTLNLPFTVDNAETNLDDLTLHGDLVITTGHELQVNDDATIGNTGTDQFTVNARTDHYGETVFHEDVTVTTGDEFTAHGPVTLDGTPIIIGQDGGSNTVYGGLNVHNSSTFFSDLTVNGNTTLGSNASDITTARGTIVCENDIAVADDGVVDGSLLVGDGITVVAGGITVTAGGAQVHGSSEFFASLTVDGNTTLGSSSSDTITTNAQLASPLTMNASAGGRIIGSQSMVITGSPALSSLSSRTILMNPVVSNIHATIDDSGMQEGDRFDFIFDIPAGRTVLIDNNQNAQTISLGSGNFTGYAVRTTAGWYLRSWAN